MQRIPGHGEEREPGTVGFADGAPGAMIVRGTDFDVLEISSVMLTPP